MISTVPLVYMLLVNLEVMDKLLAILINGPLTKSLNRLRRPDVENLVGKSLLAAIEHPVI